MDAAIRAPEKTPSLTVDGQPVSVPGLLQGDQFVLQIVPY
jgi:hypothetical protein